MQSLKNILLFRLTIIFFLNIYFKNIFIFLISILLLFILDKKESLILIVLLAISLVHINLPTIGYVSRVKDDIAIINNTEFTNLDYSVGDFVFKDKVFKNTPYKMSLNHLNSFNKELSDLFKKILFNDYVSDQDLIFNIGYGFGLYFLLRKIFDKNKYLSLFLLFIYSMFFDFELKLLFLIIDFILSFFEVDNINNLSIKIIVITLIDIKLFLNYSILLTLLFSFIYKSNYYKSKFLIGLVQSFFFGQVNILSCLVYNWYLNIRIFIFIISLLSFVCPLLLPIYLIVMKVLSYIIYIFLISIRGKISIITLMILLISYLFGIRKDYQLYLLLLMCLLTLNNPIKHVTFIDVGQGDATLISNINYKILIDTGSAYNYHKLKKTLYEEGVYTLDYLLISHNDEDHCGNVDNLMRDFKIKKTVYDKYDIAYKDLYFNCLDVGIFDNDNDNSVVYYLDINDYSFLFTGDISKNVERLIVNRYAIDKVNCLKVSHHGSATGTSSYFVGKILPDYAIISTNGKYNHPHKETLDTLNSYLVDILITKELGNIKFNFIGNLKYLSYKNQIIVLK